MVSTVEKNPVFSQNARTPQSGKRPLPKGYPAQGQQQNYRSEQDKRATIMMIAARLL